MATVRKAQRERMRDYVVSRLEDSGITIDNVSSADCLEFRAGNFPKISLFLHSSSDGAEDFRHRMNNLLNNGQFVANIFYKDGKTFFVPLAQDKAEAFYKTTMVRHTLGEVKSAISLRKKEEYVLGLQGLKELAYYQPETTSEGGRLKEGLVTFGFKPSIASYTHKDPELGAYPFIIAHDGEALSTRMISGNKRVIDGNISFKYSRPEGSRILILDQNSAPVVNPQTVSEELVQEFLRQNGTTLADYGGNVENVLPYIDPQ